MKTYHVFGKVTGTKYLGRVSADSLEEAIRKAGHLDSTHVNLCHQCAGECEDPEVEEISVEEEPE